MRMPTFPFRSLSVATVVSIVAGIIYRLTPNNYYPQPVQTIFKPEISKVSQKIMPVVETITDFLKEDKKVLLTKDGSSTRWNANWTSLQKKYNISNIPSHWNFQGLRQALTGNIAISRFKEQCQINSKKVRGRDDPLYAEVKEYCTDDIVKNGK